MKPTIGRIVHFRAPQDCGGEIYAGIVVKVNEDETVNLMTFGTGSVYAQNGVPFSEDGAPGAWSWPPRS